MQRYFILFLALLGLMLVGAPAMAAYPERPITLIVPFGAGGTTDIPARLLAGNMEKILGQPIVVLNVTGGNGTQGVAQAAAAAADGYTLLYGPTGAMVLQPHVAKTPYDNTSFEFIGNAVRTPVVLMSSKKAPWTSFEEMIEVVRKEPNKYIAAITGTGNMTHIPIMDIVKKYDLKLRVVPYRTAAEVLKDMTAGRTHLFADPPIVLNQGDLLGLVQFTDTPAEGLNVPTTVSKGYDKKIAHWQGLFAPKGIPQEAQARLAQVMQQVCTGPDFKAEAIKIGTTADWMGPEDFKTYFNKEYADYGVVIREMNAAK